MVSKTTLEEIKAGALSLGVGETQRVVCSSCGGGSTKEKSLSVTRKPEGLVYKCFRDRCQIAGFVSSKNNFHSSGNFGDSVLSNSSTDKSYKGKTYLLSPESRKFLITKFFLHKEDLVGLRQTEEGDIMFPMKDCMGLTYGYVNRRYRGLVGRPRVPKSINYYTHEPENHLHFPEQISNEITTAVLTEDILSAQRVSMFTYAVALMGTHLSEPDAAHLYGLGITKLVILLDSDANNTSRKIKDKYSLMFPECISIQRPPKELDPKDMSNMELMTLLEDRGII